MQKQLLYITAANRQEAEHIAKTLVEERLAACANILGVATSFYWWQGKVESAEEVAVTLKTTKALEEQVIERVKALHSYECPCVVSLPIENGNREFLDWIEASVKVT